MPTYPVTGTLTDLGLTPRPNLIPWLVFTPPEVAALGSGHVVFSEPVRVTPASNGTFTAPLASTDDLLYRGRGWQLAIEWLRPDGYAVGGGHAAADHPAWLLNVPRGGGRLVDLIDAQVVGSTLAIVNGTNSALLEDLYSRGVRRIVDTSTTPAAFGRLEA